MYDIVCSLPLDLLIHVVTYLDLEDVIIRCQRVSKRWNEIFTSDAVIRSLLGETLAFLGLDIEGVGVDDAMADAMSYLQWRHRLQHARPIKKISLPWPRHLPTMPDEVHCCSRRLCYNVPSRNKIEMLNLETGQIVTWAGNEKDFFRHFNMSDRYLVLMSYEEGTGMYTLTAWNYHTNQKFEQRIPDYGCMTIVEDKVVTHPVTEHIPSFVYVWDLTSNHVQKIGSFSYLKLFHVAAAQNILVAFEMNLEKQTSEIRQTKWTTTTGQLLEEKFFHLSMWADQAMGKKKPLSNTYFRTYGHKTVAQIHYITHPCATMHLEYDYTNDLVSVQLIRSVDPGDEPIHGNYPISITPYLVYRWTRKRVHPVTYDATTGISVRHSCHIQNIRALLPRNSVDQQIEEHNVFWFLSIGDREAFGLAGDGGIELWFCNPNFVPGFLEQTIDSDDVHEP